jgi:hypothetical protein
LSASSPFGWNIVFHAGGRDQSRGVDNFKIMIGELDDTSFAKNLKCAAYVDIGEADRLPDLALTER